MVDASNARRERIDGMSAFAAAGLLLCLGLIYALERVGAPDAFVEALGPLVGLIGLCAIGIATRAANLTDFLAAGRGAPAFPGGLAFAAVATGLTAALLSDPDGAGGASWRGIAAGMILAAIVVAPRWRRENASALADVLATRFPAMPTRVVFALILAVIGALTAVAGFDLATSALMPTFAFNPRAARALVLLAIAVSVAPGGLKGLLWSDAASAGAALLIGAIGAGLELARSPAPLAELGAAWGSLPAADAHDLWSQAAMALAVAFFFALAAPAIGAASAATARRAGFAGLAFVAIGLVLASIALSTVRASHTSVALTEAARLLPALALARAGALGAARARGLDLTTAHSRLAVLASRRIALIRLGVLIVVALCPYAGEQAGLDAARAIWLALAASLAFVTPSALIALAFPASTSPASAFAALGASFAVAAVKFYFAGGAPSDGALMAAAGVAGMTGLVVGMVATMVFPGRATASLAAKDPFADSPY